MQWVRGKSNREREGEKGREFKTAREREQKKRDRKSKGERGDRHRRKGDRDR